MILFDRVWKLTCYRDKPDELPKFVADLIDARDLTNATEITDLRMQFSIDKSLSKEPNTCEITISNCSESTRADLVRKPLHVKLEAGYDGELRHLFSGDLTYGSSKIEGPNWETKLNIGDGSRVYVGARHKGTYKAGTTYRTVIKDAAATMGFVLPPHVDDDPLLDKQFSTSQTAYGQTADTLTKLLAPFGYRWSIQNGALVVLTDEDVSPTEVIQVYQDVGLIGTPEFGTPDKLGNAPTLSFQMLLYPQLTPGGLVEIESESVNGGFKLQKVSHKGDTHGKDWTSECEAVAVDAVKITKKKKGKK